MIDPKRTCETRADEHNQETGTDLPGTASPACWHVMIVNGITSWTIALVEGSSHYIRTEPWVMCQFDPHNRGEAH